MHAVAVHKSSHRGRPPALLPVPSAREGGIRIAGPACSFGYRNSRRLKPPESNDIGPIGAVTALPEEDRVPRF